MKGLFLFLFVTSLSAEAGCFDIFKSSSKKDSNSFSKSSKKTRHQNSSEEISTQHTSNKRLANYERDIPSHFYSSNPDFVTDSIDDMRTMVDRQKKTGKFDDKYLEFDSMLDFILEDSQFSFEVSQILAKKILERERADEYYLFKEYPLIGAAPLQSLLKIIQSSNTKHTNEKIRKKVLENYKNATDQISFLIKYNKDAYAWFAEHISLYGNALWQMGKREDAELFLQTSHEHKGVVGSYYLALNTIEDHIYNNRSIDQAIEYTEDAISLLTEAIATKKTKDRPYYQDKLMKLLTLSPFVYKKSLISLQEKTDELNRQYENKEGNKEVLTNSINDTKKKYEDHSDEILANLFFYLVLTKYSKAEEMAGIKYGITAGGFVVSDQDSQLIQIIEKYNKSRDEQDKVPYRNAF